MFIWEEKKKREEQEKKNWKKTWFWWAYKKKRGQLCHAIKKEKGRGKKPWPLLKPKKSRTWSMSILAIRKQLEVWAFFSALSWFHSKNTEKSHWRYCFLLHSITLKSFHFYGPSLLLLSLLYTNNGMNIIHINDVVLFYWMIRWIKMIIMQNVLVGTCH